jgi:hypothetical protein
LVVEEAELGFEERKEFRLEAVGELRQTSESGILLEIG